MQCQTLPPPKTLPISWHCNCLTSLHCTYSIFNWLLLIYLVNLHSTLYLSVTVYLVLSRSMHPTPPPPHTNIHPTYPTQLGKLAPYVCDLLKPKAATHSYTLDQPHSSTNLNCLDPTTVKTNRFNDKSFTSRPASLWNVLPNDLTALDRNQRFIKTYRHIIIWLMKILDNAWCFFPDDVDCLSFCTSNRIVICSSFPLLVSIVKNICIWIWLLV